jgi:UDP-N-acetyl-D-mannosaminuronic acid transferase (WecB/TagA/CpsF family)
MKETGAICAKARIVGMNVDVTSYRHAVETVACWSVLHASKYVCVATVNPVMEAYDSPEFLRVKHGADSMTPDGMSLVWGCGCRDTKTPRGFLVRI